MIFTFLGKKYNFDLNIQGDRAILVFCMSIAFVFWFFTKMSNVYSSERIVDVEFILPEGQAFADLPAEVLTATVEGRGWDLISDYLFGGQAAITVDLQTETTDFIDQSSLLSRISDRSLDKRDLTILKTNPAYFSLKYEEEISKIVPVKLHQKVSYAAGHFPTQDIQFIPDSVTIKGAKAIIDTINSWKTTLISVRNLEDSIELIIPLQEKLEKRVKLSDKEIKVSFAVEEWTEKQLYSTVKILNGPDSLKLFPQRTEITFSCPLSIFDEINERDFETVVDLKDIPMNEKNNTVPVLITRHPILTKALKISPNSVQFFFHTSTEEETIQTNSKSSD